MLTKGGAPPPSATTKANVWLGIFGFVGNYWYTHYFYSVWARSTPCRPGASTTCLWRCLATHFYFCFYRPLERRAPQGRTSYGPSSTRTAFEVCLVVAMSYLTASSRRDDQRLPYYS